MKIVQIGASVLIISILLGVEGCKAKDTTSANAAKPAVAANANEAKPTPPSTPAVATNNANTSKESPPAPADTSKNPQLIGTYMAREVDDKGVVTLISKIKTVISFSAAGTYSRASQALGKIYHSDSGQFRIEPPNKLVLTIQTSKKTILKPPIEKIHTFSLSSDGDELRLTSDKGTTAVFHRVSKPKGA